jgi:hypothetical protein
MRTRLVVRRAQLISKLCWQQTSDCLIINFISLFHVTLSTRPYWKSKQHTYTAELGCCVHSADPRSEMCVAPSTVYATTLSPNGLLFQRRPLSFTWHKTNSRRIKQKTVNLNKNFSRLVLKALLLFILAHVL